MHSSSPWLLLSLACAFFTASTAALSKILLKKHGEFLVMWAFYAFALPVFLVAFILAPKPHLTFAFWKIVAILLPFELSAFVLYLHALKISPISLVFPFLGLTPVFTILTSSLILKEQLPPAGIGGVILVSFGAYILNADAIKEGLFAPVRNMCREKGVMIMILVALIYGFTSVLGKKAILLSGPGSYPAIYYGIFFLIVTPIAYLRLRRGGIKAGGRDLALFIALGLLFAIAILFHFYAITMTKVSYMISVKRLSLVIGVLYGAIIFKERNIGFRLIGSLVMLCGVVVLSFSQ